MKVDYEWLSWLVDHDNQVKLSLIGPIDSSCNKQDLFKKLCQHPRVTWHGSVNYSEISKLLRSQNYGIVFPSDNLYTRSSTPMKFLDYMSNGLYVLTRNMPFVSLYNDLSFSIIDSISDINPLLTDLTSNIDHVEKSILSNFELLPRYTYSSRVNDIFELISCPDLSRKSQSSKNSSIKFIKP